MVTALFGDPRVSEFKQATAALVAPGQHYEVVDDEVLGQRLPVFVNRPRSLRDILVDATEHGDRDAYVFDDGRRISFVEIERQAAAVAAALRDRHGIGPGDRIAICAANSPEWIQLFWAVASLDAVLVAMNGWWTGGEMRNALELAEPALLLMDEKRLARLDGDPGVPVLVIERDFASLLEDEDAVLPDTPIAEDDPFMLIFTSGTTGRPKAAVLSHRTVIGYLMLQGFIAARGMHLAGRTPPPGPPTVRLTPFPLFHVSGLGTVVSTLLQGGTTVWPLGRFDPEKAIELTMKENIGSWGGATTHVMRLLESPAIEQLDVRQIVQVGVGGSATPPELVRRTEARFPHLVGTFSTGYGSTETGGLVSWAPNWMLREAVDCVGPALPTVEIRITDDYGEVLPDGEEGNIEARSSIVMLGYWRNDEANRDTMRADRWIRTGDFGRIEDELLFIASRRRDLIIRGGENIYPFEIENRIEEHPDVVEVAVLGVDHEVLGQEVSAVVVVRDGAGLTADEVRSWCAEALASYKIPTQVDLRTEPLPRNATGKVMKHVLAGQSDNSFVED